MAKNNLFLGTASGKVGDVVLMRRNGAQVSRVRVREISNPRSEGQAVQRSIFAPVAKFYSPLSVVLEKSFEGLSRQDSYSKFLRVNIQLAKANGWSVPKGTGFFPFPYKLSDGTIPSIDQSLTSQYGIQLNIPDITASVATFGDFSRAMVAAGYENGDQLTFIFVQSVLVAGEVIYSPVAFRIFLDVDSVSPLADVMPSVTVVPGAGNITFTVPGSQAAACIVSRYESGTWRRSTTFLQVAPALSADVTHGRDYSVASYRNAATVPVSSVYLNGSTLAAGSSSARILSVTVGNSELSRGGTSYNYTLSPIAGVVENATAGLFVTLRRGTELSATRAAVDPWSGRFDFTPRSLAADGLYSIVLVDEGGNVFDTFGNITAEGDE